MNRARPWLGRRVSAVVGVTVVAVGLVGCGGGSGSSGSSGGSSDEPIRVGAVLGLTGPVAVAANNMLAGLELAFDEVNEAGGINGREIELVVKDDAYDAAKGVAAVRELVERDKVIALTGIGTAMFNASRDYLEAKKVPMLFPSGSSTGYEAPAGYTFFALSSIPGSSYVAAKYSIENRGSKKIGIIRLDAPLGIDGAEGCTRAAEDHGAEIVGEIAVQPTSSDFSGALAKLRSDGADSICAVSLVEMVGLQMTQAEQMGWKPNWFSWTGVADTALAQLGGAQAQGIIVATTNQFASDDPEVVAFRENLVKASPDADPGYYSGMAYESGHLIADAIEEAGPDPSGEDVRNAVLSWKDHPAPANLSDDLTFAPDKPVGIRSHFVLELKGEEFEVLEGPVDPGF
jgi:branched-chain amino acid transport system substrate-binding protein